MLTRLAGALNEELRLGASCGNTCAKWLTEPVKHGHRVPIGETQPAAGDPRPNAWRMVQPAAGDDRFSGWTRHEGEATFVLFSLFTVNPSRTHL